MNDKIITAAIIIIGNEILSGRTQDTNANFLALQLTDMGINLKEVRVIPDDEAAIISHVNELKAKYTYIFTTGGIGPTHDDITSASVAKAFGAKLLRHSQAVGALKKHYKLEELNEARLKMADIPEGASLIPNPVSSAPGFILENVYVMAGVPVIMQAMFMCVRAGLHSGIIIKSKALTTDLTEGKIATDLSKVQAANPDVIIGSYPFIKDGTVGVSLVIRSEHDNRLDEVAGQIKKMIDDHKGNLILE